MKKPIIKESEKGVWKYAFCPKCDKQLKLEDNSYVCPNEDYKIEKTKIKWVVN